MPSCSSILPTTSPTRACGPLPASLSPTLHCVSLKPTDCGREEPGPNGWPSSPELSCCPSKLGGFSVESLPSAALSSSETWRSSSTCSISSWPTAASVRTPPPRSLLHSNPASNKPIGVQGLWQSFPIPFHNQLAGVRSRRSPCVSPPSFLLSSPLPESPPRRTPAFAPVRNTWSRPAATRCSFTQSRRRRCRFPRLRLKARPQNSLDLPS